MQSRSDKNACHNASENVHVCSQTHCHNIAADICAMIMATMTSMHPDERFHTFHSDDRDDALNMADALQ